MTRILRNLAVLAAALLVSAPALAGSASPIGQWQVATGEARYKVTACGEGGNLLCAKLVWLAPSERTEKNLALLNTYVVRGAAAVDENKWTGNVVFNGHAYDGTMTLVSNNSMKLKGCSGMLCQTLEFTRI
ncbi:MAG TPA: DUF2147 domain-containing protein [Devosia sp.]|nr:DUF2147 domain-containing protein [Devosia sp.]